MVHYRGGRSAIDQTVYPRLEQLRLIVEVAAEVWGE
jgi:hypothetical protein